MIKIAMMNKTEMNGETELANTYFSMILHSCPALIWLEFSVDSRLNLGQLHWQMNAEQSELLAEYKYTYRFSFLKLFLEGIGENYYYCYYYFCTLAKELC